MKMEKHWKRFFTLDRHHAEGFTLVELIVVIAILAILGGVAVPAYSGYIKKANETVDMTLASDVADALTLYYYSHPETTGGYVVLVPEGTAYPSGDGAAYQIGAAAMSASFGESWRDSMVLKSDDWEDSGLVGVVLNQEDAQTVTSSSYLNGTSPAELLGDVSSLTGSALKFLTNVPDDMLYDGMSFQFAGEDKAGFNELCKTYGIEVVEKDDGSFDFGEDVTEQQLANLMVAASANDFAGYKESGFNDSEYSLSSAGAIVLSVASYKAFVCSEYASDADKAAYEKMLTDLNSATSISEVQSITGTFESTVETNFTEYWDDDESGIATNDFQAFANIMQTVDSLSGEIAGNLNDPNLFAEDSKVADYFGSYITAIEAKEELQNLNLPDGSIVVFMNIIGGELTVTSTVADILA